MRLPSPDKLDELLCEHLTTALEPQRGRAAAAFRRHIQAESQGATDMQVRPVAAQRIKGNVIPRRALWFWAGVPSALAACLAVVVTLQFANHGGVVTSTTGVAPGSNSTSVAGNGSTGTLKFENLNQVELSRDINGGIALLNDDTPVRVIHRQSVRETQWQDPQDHATYSLTQPVEDVGYVKVQPY